jgi:hypothetical protein
MRKIWKNLSLESKINTVLTVGAGIAWAAYYVKIVTKVVQEVDEDLKFLREYAEADVKTTEFVYRMNYDASTKELDSTLPFKTLWPGGPTLM